ncbi:MAG: hypothetical protein U9N53_13225 [Bacteroidota bacterium]|nr:hypothetical protein [Bacteroidota bacterium]
MKTFLLPILLILFATASCTKGEYEDYVDYESYSLEYEMFLNWSPVSILLKGAFPEDVCGEQSYDLFAGQTINVGNLMVSNDDEFIYVTYLTDEGWMLKEIHLYVGPIKFFPVTKSKIPVPGQFPIKEEYLTPEKLVTFTIPLSEIPECPLIAAHAVVVKDGMEETAWGFGTSFDDFYSDFRVKKWGWVINDYCVEECQEELILSVKSWVLEPYACDDTICYNSFFAVSSGELISSSDWCYFLGIRYFSIGDIYPFISSPNTEVGNISVTDSTAIDGTYYLTIDVNVNEGSLITKSHLFVGTRANVFGSNGGDCPNYQNWPYMIFEKSDNHHFIIPYDEIND